MLVFARSSKKDALFCLAVSSVWIKLSLMVILPQSLEYSSERTVNGSPKGRVCFILFNLVLILIGSGFLST